MAKININMSGLGGLSQFPSQNARNAYAIKDGAVINGEYNPFIRYGYMSPATSTVTNVTTDNTQLTHFRASEYDGINDDFYLFEDGAIYKGDTTTDTSLTRQVQTPNTNADGARDLAIYMVNGVRKLFFVYQANAGNAEIGISDLPYDTSDDNLTWLTGTVSGAFSNTLSGDAWIQVSDNGFAYFFMENQVYKIDGTAATGGANGTISSALLFPVGYKMADSLDYKGKIFIGVHNYNTNTRDVNPSFKPSGKLDIGVYIWNRSTTSAEGADWIPLSGYKEIKKMFVSPSGRVRIIAIDDSGYTVILEYTGSSFQPIFKVGFDAYPVYRDQVSTFGQMTTWFGHDGVLYMYGSINPGDDEGLYKLHHASVSSTTAGVLITAPGTASVAPAIYFTYQSSGGTLTNSRLQIFTIVSQAGTDTTAANTIVFPLKYLPKLSTVNFIRIFGVPCATTGSTTIATVSIFLNQSSSSWADKTISLTQWSKGYVDIPVQKPYVNSIQLDIAFASGLTIGTSDFVPVYAEIDYTPTETNK